MNTTSIPIRILIITTFIAGCQPVVMKTPNQKIILTNEIDKTDVVGDSDFTMVIDGIVFEAEPIDARVFDGNRPYRRAITFDGGTILLMCPFPK